MSKLAKKLWYEVGASYPEFVNVVDEALARAWSQGWSAGASRQVSDDNPYGPHALRPTGPDPVDTELAAWTVGWRAAMNWLAEHKGFEGIALADEMASRLPDDDAQGRNTPDKSEATK